VRSVGRTGGATVLNIPARCEPTVVAADVSAPGYLLQLRPIDRECASLKRTSPSHPYCRTVIRPPSGESQRSIAASIDESAYRSFGENSNCCRWERIAEQWQARRPL
jgi:hypothetical protein